MDPRYQPQGAAGHPAGRWAPQPGAYGYGPAPEQADDALVRLGGWLLAFLVTTLLATVALAVGGVAYVVATWRRWRWWPLALSGLAGLLVVLAVSGPAGAVDRHLLALRELTDTAAGRPVGAVVGERWPAWLLAQLPLAVPLGLLLVALGRHQVAHVAAHELSPRARRRREAEDRAQLASAVRRSASAPATVGNRPVLNGTGSSTPLPRRRAVVEAEAPDSHALASSVPRYAVPRLTPAGQTSPGWSAARTRSTSRRWWTPS